MLGGMNQAGMFGVSSSYIMGINSSWGQSHMASMMGSSQLSQNMMGGMMSQGMSTGMPLMSGAAGLLGLDPLSLGMKAGSMAWRGGAGVMGAGLAGMGAMAGIGVVGAGAAFAGGQMLSGAQQQMQLNRGLAQNFNFQNQQGGMGFTNRQGFQIGEDIRAMTHEFGGGGEVATFSELSRLAVNMGRMGMGQNVRTVREFKDKFKQMVDSIKTIATELGTSLEEAQKMMASMRQVGIFKPGQAVNAATAMRSTALGGGLSMSEVSGMMNIGSQISRSVGGLGAAGAMGGMRTIGQVGTAMQMGVISDEDIYNATGLSGAEGRQAFATNMMSRSANFLRGGRGRRFLASIAGRNGQLDEDAAMEYLTGDVSTGRTMQLAGQNLGRTGRANFIRNEGRLRGAALEKFGGLAESMVYKGWLAERGWDPTQMDDRSKLAFQRFSGLGRDEADTALNMVSRLPEIVREQQNQRSMTHWGDAERQRMATSGVEGAKRKIEQLREGLQGKLQQAGADVLKSGSDMIESWVSQITGLYERQYTQEMDRAFRAGLTGTATGRRMFQEQFGRGGGGAAGAVGLRTATAADFYGGGGGLLGKMFDSPAERYAKSGYRFNEGMSIEAIRSRQEEIERISIAAVARPTKESMALGKQHEKLIRNLRSSGELGATRGEDRLSKYREVLRLRAEGGDEGARALMMEINKKGDDPGAMMALISGLEEGAGIEGAGRKLWGADRVGFGAGLTHMTREERAKQIGDMLTPGRTGGQERTWTSSWGGRAVAGVGGLAAAALAIPLAVPLALGAGIYETAGRVTTGKSLFGKATEFMDRKLEDWFGNRPDSAIREGIGAEFELKENQALISRIAGGDQVERAKAFKDVTRRMIALQDEKAMHGKLARSKEKELGFLQAAKAANTYAELKAKYGNNIPRDALEKAINKEGLVAPGGVLMTVEQLVNTGSAFEGIAASQYRDRQMEAAAKWGEEATRSVAEMESTGVAEYKDGKLQLTRAAADKFTGTGRDLNFADLDVANRIVENMSIQKEMSSVTTSEGFADVYKRMHAGQQELSSMYASMSVAQKRKLASKLRLTGQEGAAEDIMYRASVQERLTKSAGKGGAIGAVSQMLGMDLSKEEQQSLKDAVAKGGAGVDAIAASMAKKTGLEAEDIKAVLTSAAGKGGKVDMGTLAEQVVSLKTSQDATAKEKKEKDDPALSRLDAIREAITNSGKDSTNQIVAAINNMKGAESPGQPGGGESRSMTRGGK